ncbi:MAG TPA: hypothetical protein VFA92_14745 [Candidatus Binatia bacterium]|nr:hypothetical protein [Candidatus Binatia bacterium]
MADGRFTPTSTVREVLDGHPEGRQLLYEFGYDVGVGFVDVLSQHQSLLTALRAGRLRDLDGLLQRLNGSPATT